MVFEETFKKEKDKVKTILFNGENVTIRQYLPIQDKYDLVMITAQDARESFIYNPIKLDYLFNVNIVKMYTDIEFNNSISTNEIYDIIKCNGLLDKVLENIPENEYTELMEWLVEYTDLNMEVGASAGAVIKSIIQDLPKNAQAAQEILDNFDKEKYQEVINFARAANGGRAI